MATTKKAAPKTAKNTTKKSTTKKSTPKDPVLEATGPDKPFRGRTPQVLAQQVGYAYAGLVNDVVNVTTRIPGQLPQDREAAATRARAGMDQAAATFRANFDARVADGRKVTADLLDLPQVKKVTTTFEPVVKQAGNTRRQLRAAATSVRKTASEANKAATEQAGTAGSQLKAAVTSVTNIADAALGAGRKQAGNARTQVKAAVTSTRKTVDSAVEATRKLAS